jgi:hypothetical protein
MVCSYDEVTSQHDLETAGHGLAVDRGYHRLRTRCEHGETGGNRGHVFTGCKGFEVHAGTEDLFTGTSHDDRPNCRVRCRVAERLDETEAHRRVQGIAGLGSVEREYKSSVNEF